MPIYIILSMNNIIRGIFTIPEFTSQPFIVFTMNLVPSALRVSSNLDMLPLKKRLALGYDEMVPFHPETTTNFSQSRARVL